MTFVSGFGHISSKDVASAGGKGASLGEMTRAGIPVPPGFIVTAQAFERFLKESELGPDIAAILKRVRPKDLNSVDRASNQIRAMIEGEEMPEDLKKEILAHFKKLKHPLVAVRSSATAEDSKVASWAGELESYLNTSAKGLIANIRRCWSSLFTPRAIFYRIEKKLLAAKVSVAVVVQAMVQSDISGITFTVHPVTEDASQMIIEAGWGLGEAIVSGIITPDSYVIDKNSMAILDVNVSEQKQMIRKYRKSNITASVPAAKRKKQKLSSRQIAELAEICARIEKHYGFPCDIEWAHARGRFHIVQSRPITTLH